MKPGFLSSTIASGVLLLASGALAVAQTPERVRGTVESLSGNVLTVKSREGKDIAIKLGPDMKVSEVAQAEMDQIKPGTFVGITASGPESRLRAIEVHLFPEAMRGVGEGHYGWDLEPGTTMTNGNIDGEVSSTNGRQLTVSYKGGTSKITVPPNKAATDPCERSVIPTVIMGEAAAGPFPVAFIISLPVMMRDNPHRSRIRCTRPVSLMPAVMMAHGIPITLDPNKTRTWRGGHDRQRSGRRGRTDGDADGYLGDEETSG